MKYKGYEAVIGLELHVELKTEKKAFCACSTEFGGEMNTKCCPVCLGVAGTKPELNPEAVKLAVRAGLALGCDVSETSAFDRKHYVSPDLPKGYQITQYYRPLCTGGKVIIDLPEGEKTVRIERIHMEEDAGSLHRQGDLTVVDFNRCGIPLIEIVTKADIRTPEEAMATVRAVRGILLFAGVSDCLMNEGSLRCDVNISIRPEGAETLGVRCEIKNIGSVSAVGKTITVEMKRQVDLLLNGGEVLCETRRYDEDLGVTIRMRDKETCEDYGYIREPDLDELVLPEGYTDRVKADIPPLPRERMDKLRHYGISEQHIELICSEVRYADYFDEVLEYTGNGISSNMFVSEIIPKMNSGFPYPCAAHLAECCEMHLAGEVNIVSARRLLGICGEEGISPREAAVSHGMLVIRDAEQIEGLVKKAVEECPKAVSDVRGGKSAAKKVLIGQVMKLSRGLADPKLVSDAVDAFFA